ncbi:MAG TPA: DUF2911 domain-containing protein [Gemmatimonadales bacterium]|nr:DUF2911 domain-containing protein [Gemmatimonadales bacterium]
MTRLVRLPVAQAAALLALAAAPAAAQNFRLVLPEASPRGEVTQTIGLTNIAVNYGRPGVNNRPIWGALVPFDTVWRAGANINTVFSTTSAISVAGKPLAAGRYGLFMIPGHDKWTVIFSKEADAWGHFSYTSSEDALRITTSAVPSGMIERLEYTMDDPTDRAVTLTLRWEKLAVPIPITVDRDRVVLDSLRQQFRNLNRFFPQAWSQASAWAMNNTKDMAIAEAWADSSINIQPSFTNVMLKSMLVRARGDAATADQLKTRALGMATEAEVNAYGYQLLGQKNFDEAIAVLTKNTKDHPASANVWDSLGEAYLLKGDKAKGKSYYQKALSLYTDEVNKKRVTDILAKL